MVYAEHAAENARRAAAEVVARRLFDEVKQCSFQTEEMVIDSAGHRWLQCEQCATIKCEDAFSLIGRRNRPAIGICMDCARKAS